MKRWIYPIYILVACAMFLLIVHFQGWVFSSEDKHKMAQQSRERATRIADEITDVIKDDIEHTLTRVEKLMEHSIFIAVPEGEDQVVYIAPGGDVMSDFQQLISPKYRTSLGDLESRIKQIERENKVESFYTFFVFASKNISYKYLLDITQRYEQAVLLLYPEKGKDFSCQLRGPLEAALIK